MKRSELKDIIKECIQEMGLTESARDTFDVDALFENACIDIEESKAIEESLLMEMYGMNMYIEEKAKFSFLPKFKEREELKDFYGAVKDAEDLLNQEGEPSDTGINKFGKVALRILDLLQNAMSALSLPACLLIVPIPAYLLQRLINYCVSMGKDALATGYGKTVIKKYTELIDKETDPKKKELLIKKRDQIAKSIAKIDEE